LGISVIKGNDDILASTLQPEKSISPKKVTVAGIEIFLRLVQFKNVCVCNAVSVVPRLTCVSKRQFLNAPQPKVEVLMVALAIPDSATK